MKLSKILSAFSYVLLMGSSCFCIYYCFIKVPDSDLILLPYLTWVALLANSAIAILELFFEESFTSLNRLLDYTQTVSAVACFAADFWIRNKIGAIELGLAHTALSVMALIIYVMQDYQRQDITDLSIISSAVSLLICSVIMKNYFAAAASPAGALSFFLFKRGESICEPPHGQDLYNFGMTVFNGLSIASLMGEGAGSKSSE